MKCTSSDTESLVQHQYRGYWRQWADERFGDPPPIGGSGSLRWSEMRMEDPKEEPLAVHCFCVCSGSVLLGLSRYRERDLQSVLSIYLRFLGVYSLYIVAFFVFVTCAP